MLQAMMSEELQKRSKSQLLVSRDSELCFNLWEGSHNPTLALLSPKSLQQCFGSVSCNFCLCSCMVLGRERKGKTGWEQSHPHWALSSGFACFVERLNSEFERLLFCQCRNRDTEGCNGNLWGDVCSTSLPRNFECWKDAKCKTRHWVELVWTCGLCMWFCFLFTGGKKS